MKTDQFQELVKAGRLDDALTWVDSQLSAHPDDAELLYERAVALMLLNEDKSALNAAKKVLELAPEMAKALHLAASICIKLGDGGQAVALAHAALRAPSNERLADCTVTLGDAYTIAGEYEKAVDTYNKIIEASPKLGTAWVNRGLPLLHLGKLEAAKESVETGMQLMPEHPTGPLLLREIRSRRDRSA